MASLPPGLTPYRQTPVFNASTIPEGLLRDHSTKAGVWGLIHVSYGTLKYRIADSGEVQTLTAGCEPGVIEPEVLHSVEPVGPVSFHVEFWR